MVLNDRENISQIKVCMNSMTASDSVTIQIHVVVEEFKIATWDASSSRRYNNIGISTFQSSLGRGETNTVIL